MEVHILKLFKFILLANQHFTDFHRSKGTSLVRRQPIRATGTHKKVSRQERARASKIRQRMAIIPLPYRGDKSYASSATTWVRASFRACLLIEVTASPLLAWFFLTQSRQ